METRLFNIYDRASDWLKFAEAKNAGLVAFNAAVIGGIVGAWDRFAFLECAQCWILGTAIGLLGVAACIALAAMIAIVAFLKGKVSVAESASSTMFYAHIAYGFPSAEAYLDALANDWQDAGHGPWKRGEIDLAEQIRQVSRIALHKNVHFKWAGWITLSVLGLVIGAVVIWFIHRRKVAKKPTVEAIPAVPNTNTENVVP